MEQNSELYKDLDRVLITKDEIAAKVRELGQQITRDYAGKQPVLVCILKGASVFFTDLIREIDLPLTLDFMAISSYGSATKTSGVVRILKDLDNDILGKDVIVVEDIVDTGITLSYLTKTLMQRGAKSLRIDAAGQAGAAEGSGPARGLHVFQHSGRFRCRIRTGLRPGLPESAGYRGFESQNLW